MYMTAIYNLSLCGFRFSSVVCPSTLLFSRLLQLLMWPTYLVFLMSVSFSSAFVYRNDLAQGWGTFPTFEGRINLAVIKSGRINFDAMESGRNNLHVIK